MLLFSCMEHVDKPKAIKQSVVEKDCLHVHSICFHDILQNVSSQK